MLDRKCALLLRTIQKSCGDGFKIFTVEDLVEDFPREIEIAPEVLAEMICYLEEREYIQVKYRDDASYCLTVLTKGRLYEENINEQLKEKRSFRKFVFVSFFSGLAGSIIGVLIAVLILKFFI